MKNKDILTAVDITLDTNLEPDELANFIIKTIKHKKLELKKILNNGEEVWPTTAKSGNLVDFYNCRFAAVDKSKPIVNNDIQSLLKELSRDLDWLGVFKVKGDKE